MLMSHGIKVVSLNIKKCFYNVYHVFFFNHLIVILKLMHVRFLDSVIQHITITSSKFSLVENITQLKEIKATLNHHISEPDE